MVSEMVTALLTGVANGMLLFLVAVGLTLIFGVLGVLNFAHGSLYMLGAYVGYSLLNSGGVFNSSSGFWLAVILATVIVALLGGIIERVIIRPIYDHDHIFQLLLTFALVLILDNSAKIVWGTNFKTVSVPEVLSFQVDFLGGYPAYNLFIITIGVAIAVSMWLVFERTIIGKRMKAAAEDREVAGALGMNVPLIFTLVFIVGTALAALSGVLSAPYRSIHPQMGESIIIDSFIVVVVGNMGSFSGALAGALLIGIAESYAFYFIPTYQPIVPFIILAVAIFFSSSDILQNNLLSPIKSINKKVRH